MLVQFRERKYHTLLRFLSIFSAKFPLDIARCDVVIAVIKLCTAQEARASELFLQSSLSFKTRRQMPPASKTKGNACQRWPAN